MKTKVKRNDLCPHCGKGKLEYIPPVPPYSDGHLICGACDSTYIEDGKGDKEEKSNLRKCKECGEPSETLYCSQECLHTEKTKPEFTRLDPDTLIHFTEEKNEVNFKRTSYMRVPRGWENQFYKSDE